MNIEEVKAGLIQFEQSDKFKVYQHLQPAVENSTPDTEKLVTDLFNVVANKLLSSLNSNGFNEDELKKILLDTVPLIEDRGLDTEDFEFCYELLFVLSEITGVNIQKEINDQQAYKLSPEAILDYIKKAGLDPRDFGL
jgi:hypothetical protein